MRLVVLLVCAPALVLLAACGGSSGASTREVKDLQATVAALLARTPAVVVVTVTPAATTTATPTTAPTRALASISPTPAQTQSVVGRWDDDLELATRMAFLDSDFVDFIEFFSDGTFQLHGFAHTGGGFVNYTGTYAMIGVDRVKFTTSTGRVAVYHLEWRDGANLPLTKRLALTQESSVGYPVGTTGQFKRRAP